MARRCVLSALLLAIAVTSLAAGDWQVAIISLSERSDLMLEETLEAAVLYARELTLTEERLQLYEERQALAAQQTSDQARHDLYAASDGKGLASFKATEVPYEEPPSHIAYTTIAYSPQLVRLLRSGSEATRWYMEREGLDGLLLIDVQVIDDFDRVICTAVEGGRSVLLDRLVTKGALYELLDELEAALLTYSGAGSNAALLITGGPLLLTISLDGVAQRAGQRLFILSGGELTLTLSSPSHQEVQHTLTLAPGTVTTIDATLARREEGPLTIRSLSGRVHWSVDGEEQGSSLSLTIGNPGYPLSAVARKEGFADQEIALVHDPGREVVITMEGQAALSSSLLEREQEDFYKQLRKTILLFGAYVATIALGNTTALNHQFWQVGQVASGAVAMVNLVALMAQLAAYGR